MGCPAGGHQLQLGQGETALKSPSGPQLQRGLVLAVLPVPRRAAAGPRALVLDVWGEGEGGCTLWVGSSELRGIFLWHSVQLVSVCEGESCALAPAVTHTSFLTRAAVRMLHVWANGYCIPATLLGSWQSSTALFGEMLLDLEAGESVPPSVPPSTLAHLPILSQPFALALPCSQGAARRLPRVLKHSELTEAPLSGQKCPTGVRLLLPLGLASGTCMLHALLASYRVK